MKRYVLCTALSVLPMTALLSMASASTVTPATSTTPTSITASSTPTASATPATPAVRHHLNSKLSHLSNGDKISWNGDGAQYRVSEAGVVKYQGAQSSFEVTDLKPGEVRGVTVDSLDSTGKLIGESLLFIHGAMPSGNKAGDVDTEINTAVNDDSIQLFWNALPGVTTYQISRDGAVIGQTTNPTYIDPVSTPIGTHTYTIDAVSSNGQTYHMSTTLNITSPTNTPSNTSTGSTTTSNIAVSPNYVPINETYDIQYSAFIPVNRYNFTWTGGITSWAGDNRSFMMNPTRYRLRTDITGTFGSGWSYNAQRGETIGYNSSGGIANTGYATINPVNMNNGIVRMWTNSTNQIVVELGEQASNPLVSIAGQIQADFIMDLQTNGNWSANGWNTAAPDHEIYVTDPYPQTTVMRYTSNLNIAWDLAPVAEEMQLFNWSNSYTNGVYQTSVNMHS